MVEIRIKDKLQSNIKSLGKVAFQDIKEIKDASSKITPNDFYDIHNLFKIVHESSQTNRIGIYTEIKPLYKETDMTDQNIIDTHFKFNKEYLNRYIENKFNLNIKHIDKKQITKLSVLNIQILKVLTLSDTIEGIVEFVKNNKTFINNGIINTWWNGEFYENQCPMEYENWIYKILSYIECPIIYCSYLFPMCVNFSKIKSFLCEYHENNWDTLFKSRAFIGEFQYYETYGSKNIDYTVEMKLSVIDKNNKHHLLINQEDSSEYGHMTTYYNSDDISEKIFNTIALAKQRICKIFNEIYKATIDKHKNNAAQLKEEKSIKNENIIKGIFDNYDETYISKSDIKISNKRVKQTNEAIEYEYSEELIEKLTDNQLFELAKAKAINGVNFISFEENNKEDAIKAFTTWKRRTRCPESDILKIRILDVGGNQLNPTPSSYESFVKYHSRCFFQAIVKY